MADKRAQPALGLAASVPQDRDPTVFEAVLPFNVMSECNYHPEKLFKTYALPTLDA